MGAIASGGVVVVNDEVIDALEDFPRGTERRSRKREPGSSSAARRSIEAGIRSPPIKGKP